MTVANTGIKIYLDLIASSLDSKTLNHPDTQVLVNDFFFDLTPDVFTHNCPQLVVIVIVYFSLPFFNRLR